MSETDDTDELLIIPPDFFITNPPLEIGPYYNVVDTLISQVSHLENRITYIESSSDISLSLVSNSPEMNSPSRLRKFNSNDDLNQNNQKIYTGSISTQSTPQKPRNKFTLNSLPNSPDIDRLKKSPIRRNNPTKTNEINPMLGEIDSFLSNVKHIKRLNTVRNLENDFTSLDDSKSLDIKQVDEMLKEMELQQQQMENRIKEKEQEIFKNKEKPIVKEKNWQAGDNISSVPDYGYGMRKNMYTGGVQAADISTDKVEFSDSSSESTQMTAFDKFHFKERNNVREKRDIYNLGLVSLSSLWNSKDTKGQPTKFQQKLQEERLRRQHCEQTIHELQNRILELQERVAVAIQVDEAKDKAILKFHESWEKVGSRLQDVEKEKQELEDQLNTLKQKLSENSEEIGQKISHYEREASKALNLAHSSQEKMIMLEKRCLQLEHDLKTAEINSEEFQKKYLCEIEKNRQYPEIIAQKELELNECKSILAEAKKEIFQSKTAVENCQSDLITMKKENELIQGELHAEKDNSRKLNDQKSKLVEEVNAHKNITKGLQEELNKTREQIESNKMELKNFYQGQVELVVQNKLKEFQSQLDAAEKALKEELAKKEMAIAKTAASHIQQISEKHALEIRLLEEKHQEECRLYQVQISQLKHDIEESNHKLKRQHDKHVHIEKQLHKFMESLRQDHVTTLDEMNSFRSKSFNNLEEILSFNLVEDDRKKGDNNNEEVKNGQATYRMAETPLTSRTDKGARRKEGTLQETIQMLLDKKGHADYKNYEEIQQATRDGGLAFYQKLAKEMKGKAPWK